MPTIGQRMRVRRRQLGLSQQELARLLGLPQSKISELECDVRSDMLLSTARRVARALHMSLDELAGEEADDAETSPTAPAGARG
jgi:transcriptional regulator with XRE-family HTH domain